MVRSVVADWVMHRRSDIEHTSGVRESAVHALMMTEAGIPVVAGLTAKINPLVLSLMGSAALTHGATALWDVSLATHKRAVRPVEQHIHSFLEVLPVTAAAFTACLHWNQLRRAFRSGGRPDDWKLVPKDRPLSAGYLTAIAAGVGLCAGGAGQPHLAARGRCRRRPGVAGMAPYEGMSG
ncbi:diguanylate cyclase [Streptomyces aureus]|uniref:diguanylate cyclase n=1 Tax=Streptomyces aureus TaxID=193461 RepID=UPI00368D1EFE